MKVPKDRIIKMPMAAAVIFSALIGMRRLKVLWP
jgi:hypothetical protein